MSSDEKDRYIHYLVEKVNELSLDKRAIELGVEEFQMTFDSVNARLSEFSKEMAEIRGELGKERSRRKQAETKARKLEQQLRFAQKNQFGDKHQRVRKDTDKPADADRNNEKDGFDGTPGTLSTESVPPVSDPEERPAAPKKERDLTKRPETYDTMAVAGEPVLHPTDDTKVPGRILERKTVKVFNLKMCLVEERFEMVHYVEPGKKPKWGYFPTAGHPETVTKFEGTKATPEFLQALAYEVYVKNVTFGLLHQWLEDMGMTISANTLNNWLRKGKKYLDWLVVVLKDIALEKDSIVNCDETWCKVRKYDHYKKCYIWVLVNKAEKTAVFFYEDGSRGRDVLTHFIGDAELKSIMTDGYNAYVFVGKELSPANIRKTTHQVCLSHVLAKFSKAVDSGGDKDALPVYNAILWFFNKDREYRENGYTLEKIGKERQSQQTRAQLIWLRSLMERELGKEENERSPYYTEALNYLKKFWNETWAFLEEPELPIDNNLAERTIRKLTTQRNSMLHFGSDEGLEMAAAYHSVISTVKLHGMSSWRYLGEFFKKIFNGCRDFVGMTPKNIGMAYAKC